MNIFTIVVGLTLIFLVSMESMMANKDVSKKLLRGQFQTYKVIKKFLKNSSGALSGFGLTLLLCFLSIGLIKIQENYQEHKVNVANYWNALCFRSIDRSMESYIPTMAALNSSILISTVASWFPPARPWAVPIRKGLIVAQDSYHTFIRASLFLDKYCKRSSVTSMNKFMPYGVKDALGLGLGLGFKLERNSFDHTATMKEKKKGLTITSKIVRTENVRANYRFQGRFQFSFNKSVENFSIRELLSWRQHFGALLL